LGDNLPRREVLLKLAATAALTAAPLKPARALPLAPIVIVGVILGAATFKVFRNTFGNFEAKNDEPKQVRGYVEIKVTDDRSDKVENSIMAVYSFPAYTNATLQFTRGPAATTKGSKTLTVSGEDSSDDDDFEAV